MRLECEVSPFPWGTVADCSLLRKSPDCTYMTPWTRCTFPCRYKGSAHTASTRNNGTNAIGAHHQGTNTIGAIKIGVNAINARNHGTKVNVFVMVDLKRLAHAIMKRNGVVVRNHGLNSVGPCHHGTDATG